MVYSLAKLLNSGHTRSVITTELTDPIGIRCTPDTPTGTGVLVLAGSSGRVETARCQLLAVHGVLAESVRWFGGPGQNPGPWEIPIELFQSRVAALRTECDRVVIMGTSFGAEAALLTASLTPAVDAVIAFAPTDVVWAGIHDGAQTSHWTLGGKPVPFIPYVDDWHPDTDPPAYRDLYRESWKRASPELRAAATIAVERIPRVILVAGGDDQVWPGTEHAERIARRRTAAGMETMIIQDGEAGHRVVLPGEEPVVGGQSMARGGAPAADSRLGERAWSVILDVLGL